LKTKKMDNNNKFGQFDRQTLLKYLRRELSPEDTWKVEKAMQDNPFVAEAMEGLEAAERFGVLSEDLEWLGSRMKKRRHRVKVLELPNLLNVAAVLLILLISAWLVIEISRNSTRTKNEIAMKNSSPAGDTSGSAVYNDAGTKQEKENTVLPAPDQSKVRGQKKSGENKAEPGQVKITGSSKPSAKANDPAAGPEILKSSEPASVNENNKTDLKQINPENDVSTSAESAGAEIAYSRDLSVNEDISGKNAKRNITAKAGNPRMADMEQPYTLNASAYTEPHPANGDSSYNQYIFNNLRYPESALKNKTEGIVFLQFIVGIDSTVQDLKIISGPESGCREEAVRLLEEGPKWIPATSNGHPVRSRAVFKVNFKLKR
jgi:hypothetical protein